MSAGWSVASIRLGCVQYLNAQPLIHGWPGPVVFDHPAALCQQLAEGALDVAFVSSFEYLRAPVYQIVDDVAVAASGPVYSVFLAHQKPLENVEEIMLDPASRTSVNLLRCLLGENGLQPRLLDQTGTSSAHRDETSARLLIGDQALRFRAEHGSEYMYWDLAEEWQRLTGLPFVFALWLIRPGIAGASEIAQELRTRRDHNLQELDRVIAAQDHFSPEFCAFYFRDCLRFHLGEREKAGLLRFRALCGKHGLLPMNEAPLRLV